MLPPGAGLLRALKPLQKAVQRFGVGVQMSGDAGFRRALLDLLHYPSAVGVEFEAHGGGTGAFGTAECHSFVPFALESFDGALADEVAFDFRREPEGEGQHLALDVIAEAVSVLDGPHPTVLGHTYEQYFHYHEQVPAEPRELGADYHIAFSDVAEKLAQRTFIVTFCAADGFFYPSVDGHRLFGAEVIDFKPLVLDSLLVAAYSDVPVNHILSIKLSFNR